MVKLFTLPAAVAFPLHATAQDTKSNSGSHLLRFPHVRAKSHVCTQSLMFDCTEFVNHLLALSLAHVTAIHMFATSTWSKLRFLGPSHPFPFSPLYFFFSGGFEGSPGAEVHVAMPRLDFGLAVT